MVSLKDREKSIIIDPEKLAKGKLSEPSHLIYQCDISNRVTGVNTFLILRTVTLNRFAPLLVKAMRQLTNLRIVFLFTDDNGLDDFLDHVMMLDRDLRAKIFDILCRVDSIGQVREIIQSWCDGSQNERIARACLQDGKLLITTHAMQTMPPIDFSAVPAMKKIPMKLRDRFKVSTHGRKISWDECDVDVDIDMIRYCTDARFRRLKDLNSLLIYSNLGTAMKSLREKCNLTQEQVSAIASISTKQLSRFENGIQAPTEKSLIKLASVHGQSFEEYMHSLVKLCDQLQAEHFKTLKSLKKTNQTK